MSASPRGKRRVVRVTPSGGPAMTAAWAPVALAPVVVWDLAGTPRVIGCSCRFAPGRGAPRSTGRTLGLWLSYRLRRLAFRSYERAVAEIALLAGLSLQRVRNAVREAERSPTTGPFLGMHFSDLAAVIAQCEVLGGAHQHRDVPVPSTADLADVIILARGVLRDPAVIERLLTEYVPPEVVAQVIRCPVEWLAKARAKGTGPTFIKVGRKVLYARADVEAWLSAQRRTRTRDVEADAA